VNVIRTFLKNLKATPFDFWKRPVFDICNAGSSSKRDCKYPLGDMVFVCQGPIEGRERICPVEDDRLEENDISADTKGLASLALDV